MNEPLASSAPLAFCAPGAPPDSSRSGGEGRKETPRSTWAEDYGPRSQTTAKAATAKESEEMKGHDVLENCSRQERRLLLKREERARRTGEWGDWEKITFPRGTIGCGWSHDIDTAHRNLVFAVLDRTLPNGVRHLAVSSLSQERPTWWEMQRIKNEIAGTTLTAVEVYPPQTQVVDGAEMFHIWVLPEPLTFGLQS